MSQIRMNKAEIERIRNRLDKLEERIQKLEEDDGDD